METNQKNKTVYSLLVKISLAVISQLTIAMLSIILPFLAQLCSISKYDSKNGGFPPPNLIIKSSSGELQHADRDKCP